MKINNLYNFRNPVRHFLNIENVQPPPTIDQITIQDLSWTEPINFRIRKNEYKYRSLRMPNILNFMCSLEQLKNCNNFNKTDLIDERKRLVPNLDTGDFATGIYDEQLEDDFQKLCIYDNLLKLDIKAYYERIYTHDIDFEERGQENYLTNLNSGNTNGLIMGNYISLYFAEKYLTKISNRIKEKLEDDLINCEFSYFSDDFFFFCNQLDNNRIINIFDMVLEEFNLERSDDDIEIWTYLSYNEFNLIEKYWKKIISESKARFDDERNNNNLYFTNQLIYRLSSLNEYKSKRTFLNTFFKSTYFYELDYEKYELESYNCHQICYILNFVPEILLYSIEKFSHFPFFTSDIFKKFLETRYENALTTPYNDEQLYFYFAIKILGFDSILVNTSDKVINSNNQLLISYYLVEEIFDEEHITVLMQKKDERYWFQNYHLILCTELKEDLEQNINEYLVPRYATKSRQKRSYINFYKDNIELGVQLVKDFEDVISDIDEYLNCKVEERIEVFGADNEY